MEKICILGIQTVLFWYHVNIEVILCEFSID